MLFFLGGTRGADPTFTYGFAGVPTEKVPAAAGETKTIGDLYITLTTANNAAAIGASGWTVELAVIGATVKTSTVKGVIVDAIYDEDPGDDAPIIHHEHYDFDIGKEAFFRGTETVTSYRLGLKGIVVWTVLGATTLAVLQPNGTANICRFSVEATAPATVRFKFVDGLDSEDQPNAVTFDTNPFVPVLTEASFEVGDVAAQSTFARGDANGDAKVNVSDAALIAQNIFAKKMVYYDCRAMLDITGDGRLDTADPVALLMYIFLGGATPPAPFGACGAGITSLGCAQTNCP